MKKIFAILLAVSLLASMATVASATENTTTLTTTVPAASYTLNIPADQEIKYGATETDIGNVTVTNSKGFAEGKNLEVTLSYNDFACDGVSTTIPFYINAETTNVPSRIVSGSSIVFLGNNDNTVNEQASDSYRSGFYQSLTVEIESKNWGKALAGEYTATITFTAEVVVEQ